MTRSIRKYSAVEIDTPTPVAIAIYAARQAGHFGSNASPAAGIIHPAAARHRAAIVIDGAIMSRFGSVSTTQQLWSFTLAPPESDLSGPAAQSPGFARGSRAAGPAAVSPLELTLTVCYRIIWRSGRCHIRRGA
jgi:hypothetical protein